MAALHVYPGQAAGSYLVPVLSGRFQNCLFSSDPLPAHDPHIDILRIEFDCSCLATGAFGGNQDCAAPRERIEDDPLAMAAIPKGVSNETDRFDRRVQRQQFITFSFEGIDTGIGPHIRPTAPMLAELKVVDVGCRTLLKDEHQLVLVAVEAPHAPIILDPDAELKR